ncbi:tyrosine-type recombinase/integrase [Rhodovarius crocodyli]|nr:site-specific integrase [Rhodovarius crocodyli]
MRIKLYRGWWYAVWREGGTTKRLALRTQDRDEAARALEDHKRLIAMPTTTVAGIMEAYMAAQPNERATWAWARMQTRFGHLRPDQITKANTKEYAEARKAQGVGAGTIHTELTYLRAALKWNGADGWLIEMPSKPPPKDLHLTREQFTRLLSHAKTPHVRLFLILAITTAARMGAILDLTWDRVNFEGGFIRLALGPTTKKGRATVPINESARIALEAAMAIRTCDSVIEFGGKPVKKIRKAFERVAVAAELPWVTPHVLRHTSAVWMAENGVALQEIGQYLGHTDYQTTYRVYARFTPGYLKKAAGALEVL